MPRTTHRERHFTSGDTVRNVVIGMSDGLTIPFALAAGLSGAVASSRLVAKAGMAEVVAKSIALPTSLDGKFGALPRRPASR